MLPTNSQPAGSTLTTVESQTTFTDGGGGGNIPTPPAGDTAISYSASDVTPSQTFSFGGSQTITITAKAPCEITPGHTYVAFVYANISGDHDELSPSTGYPAPMNSDGSVTFNIDLAASGGIEPAGTYTEIIFAQQGS